MSLFARSIRLVLATAFGLCGAVASAQSLQVSPSSVNFGSEPVGVAGNPWTLTLNNTGSTPVTITSIALSDTADFTLSTTCGATVGAYSNCNILVGFNPQSSGAISGAVVIKNSATAQPVSVALNGNGTGSGNASQPTATFSPSSINFGTQTVGTSSNAWTVTLNNTGAGALNISSMTLSDAADFSFTTDCGSTVGAYSNCHVNVSFAPVSPGNIVGKLVLMSNAATTAIALNGTGASAASSVVVAPSQLSFGNQNVGSASNAQTVTVSNTGSAALSMGGFSFSNNAYSVQSTTCTGTLAGNSTCNVNVVFNPTGAGSASGQMTFSAGGANQTVALSGTGVAVQTQQPTLALSPSSVNFNTLVAGQTQTWTISVNNTSPVAATLQSAIAVSGSTAFSITNTTCGMVIGANSNCQVTVTFAPQAAGSFTGQLNVLLAGANAAQVVTLSGNATANTPVVTIAPNAVNFGSVTTGQTANAWTLTVNNPGGSPITFSSPVSLAGSREFQMTTTCGAGLPAYGQCQVLVSFFPVIPGQATGQVVVNVAGGQTQTAVLNGNGVGAALTPGVTVTPTMWDFGSAVVMGHSSTPAVMTVTNSGATDAYFAANVSLTGASSFTLSGNTCSNPIPAGTSCTVSVVFSPVDTTTSTGDVVLPFDGLTNPLTVGLNGTGAPALNVVLTIHDVNFGNQTVGTSSNASVLTLGNPGGVAASIAGIVSSNSAFVIDPANSTCGATLPVGGYCLIYLNFKPTVAGPMNGTLTVTVPGLAPLVATLEGTGVSPVLVANPLSLNLGAVAPGQPSKMSFTLTNNNAVAVPFVIASLPFGFSAASACGAVAPFSTCTVYVTLQAQTVATYSGNLLLSVAGGTSNLSIAVSGMVEDPALNLNYTAFNFPSTTVGQTSAAQYLWLTNSSLVTTTFSTTLPAGFTVVATSCNGTLTAGATCFYELAFTPVTATAYSANFVLSEYSGAVTQNVLLTGTGLPLASKLVANPTSLNLTGQNYGTFVLTNQGSTVETFSYSVGDWNFVPSFNCQQVSAQQWQLAPGGTCAVTVNFYGINYGTHSTNLVISATDGTSATVALTDVYGSTSQPSQLAFSTPVLAFANTAIGSVSASQSVTVTNKGSNPDYVNYWGFVNFTGPQEYLLTGGTCTQTGILYPGASCTYQIAFNPEYVGENQSSFYLYDDNVGQYINVALDGQGLAGAATTPTYSLSVTPGQLSLSAGQTGTATFTLTPQVGFTGTVVLSCDGLPAGVTCTFVPPTLTSDGSGKVLMSQVTVSTQGINGAGVGGFSRLMWLPALMMLGLLGFRKKLKVGVLSVMLLVGMTAAVSVTTGCGMGILNGTSPLGVSLVTVKAVVNGTSGQQQTTNFVLHITK